MYLCSLAQYPERYNLLSNVFFPLFKCSMYVSLGQYGEIPHLLLTDAKLYALKCAGKVFWTLDIDISTVAEHIFTIQVQSPFENIVMIPNLSLLSPPVTVHLTLSTPS